jgi:hypothetical protein
MKHAHLLMWLFAGLTCVGLQAQTTMTANIPFDFQLGRSAMPAGQYQISYSPGMLRLQNFHANKSAVVMTVPKERKQTPKTGLMEFNHYGDTYFFAGIWAPNSASGDTVLKTTQEEELARRLGPIQPAGIALKTSR